MSRKDQRKKHAKVLRLFRKYHRLTGIALFALFFFVAITGILLGWKKNSNGYLLPETIEGSGLKSSHWLSIDSIISIAESIDDARFVSEANAIDRIDLRPNKGVAKVLLKDSYWEIQIDLTTGEVLQVAKRRSDWLENLHDASLLDQYFNTEYEQFKLIYTSIMGFGLLVFVVTGFWLWLGPKIMRRNS